MGLVLLLLWAVLLLQVTTATASARLKGHWLASHQLVNHRIAYELVNLQVAVAGS
jgi:hypothetical protein